MVQERQKLYYDMGVRHRPYEMGDMVWLNNPTESHEAGATLEKDLKGLFRCLTHTVNMGLPTELRILWTLMTGSRLYNTIEAPCP